MIPTRERWDTLRATLAALDEQSEQGFEVLVVVDGGDQEVPPLEGARVLQQDRAGPGVARNTGVAASDRPLVLFLGDDMVPCRDLVARHLERHRADPAAELGVLGRVVWHHSVRRDRLHRWLERSGALHAFPDPVNEPADDAGWGRFYSCNVSLKRELFAAAGGFDPDFAFDYEDLDLGWRLGRLGMRLAYEPRALARHLHPYDWTALRRRYESRAEAERLMMSKHDWFEPWFHAQLTAAQREPPVSGAWTWAVELLPPWPRSLRKRAEDRADRYYRQRLAPSFLAAWERARVGDA